MDDNYSQSHYYYMTKSKLMTFLKPCVSQITSLMDITMEISKHTLRFSVFPKSTNSFISEDIHG